MQMSCLVFKLKNLIKTWRWRWRRCHYLFCPHQSVDTMNKFFSASHHYLFLLLACRGQVAKLNLLEMSGPRLWCWGFQKHCHLPDVTFHMAAAGQSSQSSDLLQIFREVESPFPSLSTGVFCSFTLSLPPHSPNWLTGIPNSRLILAS